MLLLEQFIKYGLLAACYFAPFAVLIAWMSWFPFPFSWQGMMIHVGLCALEVCILTDATYHHLIVLFHRSVAQQAVLDDVTKKAYWDLVKKWIPCSVLLRNYLFWVMSCALGWGFDCMFLMCVVVPLMWVFPFTKVDTVIRKNLKISGRKKTVLMKQKIMSAMSVRILVCGMPLVSTLLYKRNWRWWFYGYEELFDLFFIMVVSAFLLPGIVKLCLMPVFGEFSIRESCATYACSRPVCCDLGNRAFTYHNLAFLGFFSSCLGMRIMYVKLTFLTTAAATLCVVMLKDSWYTFFHFCVRFRPAFFVASLRARRKVCKTMPWAINNAASEEFLNAPNIGWAVLIKVSVDWIPHWARCIYCYNIDYPFEAMRKCCKSVVSDADLCKMRKDQLRNTVVSDEVRTTYYGCGSCMMRLTNMPGFFGTDAIAGSHYRRYLKACNTPSFPKYLQLWMHDDFSFQRLEELERVSQVISDVKGFTWSADEPTPIGKVPREQMNQFQFVVVVFLWKTHAQVAMRQTNKLEKWAFIELFFLSLMIADAVFLHTDVGSFFCALTGSYHPVLNIVAPGLNENTWCRCTISRATVNGSLYYVSKVAILGMVDLVETAVVAMQQKNIVPSAFRKVVFELGAPGKRFQIRWINTWYLDAYFLGYLAGTELPYFLGYGQGYDGDVFYDWYPECKGVPLDFWGWGANANVTSEELNNEGISTIY